MTKVLIELDQAMKHQLLLLVCLMGWPLASFADPKVQRTVVIPEVVSESTRFRVVCEVDGLEFPWALEFLPDNRMLITERPGRMWIIDGDAIHPISGIPEVKAAGQGGLLDVIAHPDFANNRLIYISYAASYRKGVGTRVARAVLDGHQLQDLKVIFEMDPPGSSPVHFGSRFAFDQEGLLYFTLGERGDRDTAQRLDALRGKVIRIHDDGRVPDDNPFVGKADARPEIYSYGHRNPQGIVFDKETGLLWTHEHGPRGGDTLNIIRPALNYGWPLATHGREYYGPSIGTIPEKLDYVQDPVIHWTPSIAPCGLTQLRNGNFPAWEGNLFAGALAGQHIRRIVLEDEKVSHQEILLKGAVGRVRDVVAGPDGNIWFTTDSSEGGLYRLENLDPVQGGQ